MPKQEPGPESTTESIEETIREMLSDDKITFSKLDSLKPASKRTVITALTTVVKEKGYEPIQEDLGKDTKIVVAEYAKDGEYSGKELATILENLKGFHGEYIFYEMYDALKPE